MENVLDKETINIEQSKIYYQQVINFPNMSNLLSYVFDRTSSYINQIKKSQRKKYGQFFTDKNIAHYMANLVKTCETTVKILDPGAGSGILSAAIMDKLKNNNNTNNIEITLYENDKNILPLLYSNMEYCKKQLEQKSILLKYKVIEDNFILANENAWNNEQSQNEEYDIVISNPPYMKIPANSPEANIMKKLYMDNQIYIFYLWQWLQN